MGSGFMFRLFAERDLPSHIDTDVIRTCNSFHHSLYVLDYFMWETWKLGSIVLSPRYFKQCSNLFFTWLFSLQIPLSWRCLHWWKAQKVWQTGITYPQPTDQMADKHQEQRKGFSYRTRIYQYWIKLFKSCCIQWGTWLGHWCPETRTSSKNCAQINHVQPWMNNIFVLYLLGNF